MLIPFSEIQLSSQALGLEIIGISKAAPKPLDSSRLKLWQEKGFAAEMNYMQRDPQLQADPERLLPGAKTVISVAVKYDTRPAPLRPKGFGKVARYAWGSDYHLILPDRLEKLVNSLRLAHGDFKCRIFADAVPFLERAFAANAGLGFIGHNSLMITPKLGSFTLLAEILCDFDVDGYHPPQIRSSCGSCRRCLDSCPTSAFESPYVLNAGKCISYLSIEKKGQLSHPEREMLGDWIFGCDICQEVCPFNHGPLKHGSAPDLAELAPSFGVGPLINLKELLQITNQQDFKKKFLGTALLRSKREGLLRNAICVAVNTDCEDLIPDLHSLATTDSSPLLRQFGLWGMIKLKQKNSGLVQADREFLQKAFSDPAEQVITEAKWLEESYF